MKPGDIDRTTELMVFHALVVEQQLLPPGSDVADRFSLLMGMAAGSIMRLEAKLREAGIDPDVRG